MIVALLAIFVALVAIAVPLWLIMDILDRWRIEWIGELRDRQQSEKEKAANTRG